MTFCKILLIIDEKLYPKQFSIKNKSYKVLLLSFILIANISNYMYTKFYEVWTIILKAIAISGYTGSLFQTQIHLYA